jgi:hypothetical protein
MSLRPKAQKEKGRTKMSVRDKRILNTQVLDQRKIQEQEAMQEELEGVRQKTPTKRVSSASKNRAKSSVFSSPFLEARDKIYADCTAYIRKIQKKHVVVSKTAWIDTGPMRLMCNSKRWNYYRSNDVGPEADRCENPFGALCRTDDGQEHQDRSALCLFCKSPIPTTSEYSRNSFGECWHYECGKKYIECQ